MYTITNVLARVIFTGLVLGINLADGRNCSVNHLPCRDGSKCISWDSICNGNNDCQDGSDEDRCHGKCNKYGSVPQHQSTTGCVCKTAVTGLLCSQCRVGYYDFPRYSSKSQCLKCWCSGKTNDCTSGGRQQSWIDSITREQVQQVNDDISVVALDRSFLGNQGAEKRHISYHHFGNYTAAKLNTITIPLEESPAWHLDSMEAEAARADIMKILVNVSAMHLRTSLFIRHSDLEIISIRLGSSQTILAPDLVIQREIAYEVESYKCPCQFSGESCEDCSTGYIRYGTDCIAGIDAIQPVPFWNTFDSGFLVGTVGSSLVVVSALVATAYHKLRLRRLSQMAIRTHNVPGSSLGTYPTICMDHCED